MQGIRRSVAKEWGSVLCRVENLAYLSSWFMLGRIRDTDEDPLGFVLCLLALEATRTIFATVNQVRGGLAAETFGYWRTLYETFVIGRFLLRFSEEDASLSGRFSNSTYSMYLDFYKRFGPTGSVEIGEDSWSQIEEFYKSQYPVEGKGNYGWAYPIIAKRRPTFRDLAEAVDKKSMFLDRYYAVATSKTHGRFILGFDGVRAAGVATISGDSFSTGEIDSVLEFTLPVFRAVVENAVGPSAKAEHGHVLTGMRLTEVIALAWSQVDMAAMTVRIDDTKTGEPLEFPVTRQLAAILERRFAEREQFAGEARGWVFPSCQASASGHLESIQHLNARIGEAGGAKFWFHALRNCFITVADRELMLPTGLTKRLVNHAPSQDITEGYAADWTMEQPRNAAQSIADRIDELIRGTRPAEETASQNAFRSFAGSDALS